MKSDGTPLGADQMIVAVIRGDQRSALQLHKRKIWHHSWCVAKGIKNSFQSLHWHSVHFDSCCFFCHKPQAESHLATEQCLFVLLKDTIAGWDRILCVYYATHQWFRSVPNFHSHSHNARHLMRMVVFFWKAFHNIIVRLIKGLACCSFSAAIWTTVFRPKAVCLSRSINF